VQVFEANMQRLKHFLPELVVIMLSSELLLENRMKQRLFVTALCSAINQTNALVLTRKSGIAIKCINSLCEKNVKVKILVSDNSGFYVMIEKEKPLVTHDHVHELKQGRLSVTVASV